VYHLVTVCHTSFNKLLCASRSSNIVVHPAANMCRDSALLLDTNSGTLALSSFITKANNTTSAWAGNNTAQQLLQ